MSVVPNNELESADSLTLITFGVEMQIDSATNTIDIYTRYLSYWKNCVIRNLQPTDNLLYRTEANGTLKEIQPNSELPVKGWGSFLQVISAAATPSGRVDFECSTIQNARRKNA